MKRQALRAYTLLELMMGIFLVFCAAGYLLGTYAFGAKASLNTDRFTTAVNLGQAKMEELQNRPPISLPAEQKGKFASPHQDYYWHAQVSTFSQDFSLMTVRTGQNGAPLCTLRRLVNNIVPVSIDAHVYDSEAVFTDSRFNKFPFVKVSFWDPSAVIPKTLGIAATWPTGALCGHPGQGVVWLSHNRQPQILQVLFNAEGKNIACKAIEVPTNKQGYKAHIIDLAADTMGNFLFCADSANRALWVLDDSDSSGSYSWKNGLCLTSKQKPLKDLRSIACDQYGSTVWLCEGAPRRVRQFYWGSLPKGTKEKINSFSGWGEAIVVPFPGAGRLHSVAVNSWGSAIYTMDNGFIYSLIFQENSGQGSWQQIAMPEQLCKAQPRALWIDPGNSRLYINTLTGKQWVASPSVDGTLKSGSFSQINWR